MYDSQRRADHDFSAQTILETTFFINYQDNIKPYAPQAKAAKDVADPQMVFQAASCALAKAGLKLIRTQSGRRHGSRRAYNIQLCDSNTAVRAELMKIKVGSAVDHLASPALKHYLQNIACKRYMHLA